MEGKTMDFLAFLGALFVPLIIFLVEATKKRTR
jgi:hypothetical protein